MRVRRIAQYLILFLPPTAGRLGAQSVPPAGAAVHAVAGFGTAVAVSDGDILVAEVPDRDEPGAVYVYRRGEAGGWAEVQQLRASNGGPGDGFGRALAAESGRLLVGAAGLGGSAGSGHVFERAADGVWREVAELRAAAQGRGVGWSVALDGDVAFLGAVGQGGGGAVHVFRRRADGAWREADMLRPPGLSNRDLFGLSVWADEGRVVVGAPGLDRQRGAVFVFREHGEGWIQEARLTVAGLPPRAHLGYAVAIHGSRIVAGAPGADRGRGAAYAFVPEAGVWRHEDTLLPADPSGPQRFGWWIAPDARELWIGAPFGAGFHGAVYTFARTEGGYVASGTVTAPDGERGDDFGGAVALRGDLGVAAIPGDDYGEGTAAAIERIAGTWRVVTTLFSTIEAPDPVRGGTIPCRNGMAREFVCGNVDMISFLPKEAIGAGRGVKLNDVWGWTDPETGIDYAIVGRLDGAAFIDLRDPEQPVYVGELPKTPGSPGSTWRDIKVYQNHAFIVADGAGRHGMQVFDLTQLRDVRHPPVVFEPTAHYDGINSAHNIVINQETGYAFSVGSSSGGETCGGGLHMIDVREPTRPVFAGCFADPATGRGRTGYTHDAHCVTYRGPDREYQGREICIGANETALSIADVTDKDRPVAVSTATYPNVGYAHQGWLSDDHRYFYSNDELDEVNNLVSRTRTLVWDVSDLDDPVLAKEHFAETGSTDHNLYVRGRYMYQANNTAGLRILDIQDAANPVEAGFFDPMPRGENEAGFDGTWSSYPFFDSGVIVVTSRLEGVFVLRFRPSGPIP